MMKVTLADCEVTKPSLMSMGIPCQEYAFPHTWSEKKSKSNLPVKEQKLKTDVGVHDFKPLHQEEDEAGEF